MLDPKKAAEMDQDMATVAEIWPPLWRGIYDNCIKQGFNELESMELLKVYINTTCRK